MGFAQQCQLSGRSHGITPISEPLSTPEGPPEEAGPSCSQADRQLLISSQMRSGPGAPQMKRIGPWHQSQLVAEGADKE